VIRTPAVMRDRHFMTQSELVTPATTPYTGVYETREIPRLLDDLDAHLRAQGWEGTLALTRSNESPLAPLSSLFTPPVTESIAGVYGKDFVTFGYADIVPASTAPAAEYPQALLVAIGLLAERGERLGDLALRAQALADGDRALREKNSELRETNKVLRAENKALRSVNKTLRSRRGVRSVVRRVYRKLAAPR
jgi:hypothetical protein